jgi:hypothetical protein
MTPSEDDLDSLLKAWSVPQSPDAMERRLRRAYRERTRSRTMPGPVDNSAVRWIAGFAPVAGKFAGAIAGMVILLAVITRAFPQSLGLIASPAAITTDSEFLVYQDDGSYTVSEYRTSSILGERAIILSSYFPGDPLRTVAGDVLNPMHAILDPILQRAMSPMFYRPGREEHIRAIQRARNRNGCKPSNMWGWPMTVTGEEEILNYTTTIFQFTPDGRNLRFTEWFAPGLDCVSLRSTTEKKLTDGIFRPASEMRVVKVTTNSSRAAAN